MAHPQDTPPMTDQLGCDTRHPRQSAVPDVGSVWNCSVAQRHSTAPSSEQRPRLFTAHPPTIDLNRGGCTVLGRGHYTVRAVLCSYATEQLHPSRGIAARQGRRASHSKRPDIYDPAQGQATNAKVPDNPFNMILWASGAIWAMVFCVQSCLVKVVF